MRFTIKGQLVAESTHTSNRREAERILAKRKSELVEQVVLAGKKPIKLHDALQKFVDSRSHTKSAYSVKKALRFFERIENKFLDKVSNEDIHDLIQAMRTEEYAESTIKLSVVYFNTMLKLMEDLGYTGRKKLKNKLNVTGKIRWLTKDELARFFAALNPERSKDPVIKAFRQDNFDLARLLYETGTRFVEMAGLQWRQVDLQKGLLHVERMKGSVNGVVFLTPVMREIFERRKGFEKKEFVFSTKQRPHNERWVATAVKRAELDETAGKVTLHTLRHSKAVHLLQDGMNLLEVKTFLGHKDINSTMVYVHVEEDAVMRKAQRIAEAVTAE